MGDFLKQPEFNLNFSVAPNDVKHIYLQGFNKSRATYTQPQKGLNTSLHTGWELFHPACGLVKLGRTWKSTIEKRLASQTMK